MDSNLQPSQRINVRCPQYLGLKLSELNNAIQRNNTILKSHLESGK